MNNLFWSKNHYAKDLLPQEYLLPTKQKGIFNINLNITMGNLFPPKVLIWEILSDDTSVMVTARSMRKVTTKEQSFQQTDQNGLSLPPTWIIILLPVIYQ